jgi:acyl-CoA hydrolase
MSAALDQYRQKLRTPREATAVVRDGDTVLVASAVGEPPVLLQALAARRAELRGVTLSQLLPLTPQACMDLDSAPHIRHRSLFLSAAVRAGFPAGWVDLVPCHFSEIPRLVRRGEQRCEVVMTLASPMDAHGYFSISLSPDFTMAAIERTRDLVLEVNPNVPFAFGNCHVHISQVRALIESEAPLREVGLPQINAVQRTIGLHVAELVKDGDTLQLGYGSIPDAVVMQLGGKKDLGIHTEMIGDGLISLLECGAVTGRRKNFLPGKIVATFGMGTRRLYDAMHRNPMLEMHPVDFTNDPAIAGQNDHLVAINATLQVDLFGQCGSESLGPNPYSGTGGQTDFIRAANRSNGGRGIIVLPSTAKGDTISRIVPTLTPGTLVSTSKNDVNYVVTEHGVAQLRGKSLRERARELIAIAHPAFRDELAHAARAMALL